MKFLKWRSVVTTLCAVVFIMAFSGLASAQIVQGGLTTSDTGTTPCAIPQQTVGITTYNAADQEGHFCVVVAATKVSSGVVVHDVVTSTTPLAVTDLGAVLESTTPVPLTGPGQIYGLAIDAIGNTTGQVVWVNLYNGVASVTQPGTSGVIASFPITGAPTTSATQGQTSNIIVPFGSAVGIPFTTGLSATCTTTRGGSTITTVGCHITLLTH